MSKKSPVRRGIEILDQIGSGDPVFVSINDGQKVVIVPQINMDQMPSIDQHAFWLPSGNSPIFPCLSGTDEQCPGCQLGNRPRFRAFLPVRTKDGPRIWAFGVGIARDLAEIDEALGGIAGREIRVKRSGTGLNTRWSVVSTGKEREIGDEVLNIEDHIGPMTRHEILQMLVESGGVDVSGILTDEEAEEFSIVEAPFDEDGSDDDDDWEDV